MKFPLYVIAHCGLRFPRKPECGGLWDYERILSASDFRSRVQGGWIYFDDSVGNETNAFKISFAFVQRLLKQLRRLQMSPDCCVAVTYGAGRDPLDENAVTLLNEPFLSLRVLSPRYGSVDVDAEFYNTTYQDSATDGTPKFVFLFSGGDIDMQRMRSRLFGRVSAPVLNVEGAQRFRLCRLY